jgi:hypothetical protein
MAKGGARYGAGRPAYKVKAEYVARVDIRVWSKRGLLSDSERRTWSWSRGDERAGSISFSVSEHSINLIYSINGKDASQRICRVSTLCHYGGSRPWFCCPVCQSKSALLYLRAGRFACRRCQRVSYRTQSGTSHDRLCRLYHQLAAKIESGKPKWQRWATFNRLEDRFERVSLQFEASLYGRLMANYSDHP